MKTSELIGAQLDYWVARAEGLEEPTIPDGGVQVCTYVHHYEPGDDGWWIDYQPSTDWAQGGPIIERERIELRHFYSGWRANIKGNAIGFSGPENAPCPPLSAAMRAYVASKFGDEVEADSASGRAQRTNNNNKED